MEHAWCRDVARDAAVRAAEDGRDRPLPTLGEAIARPFADAAERPVPVSKTGEGQSGLRTERVTLEFRWPVGLPLTPWAWDWKKLLFLNEGESVRVVSKLEMHCEYDDIDAKMEKLTSERDAAIRERETLRGEIASVRNCWHVSRAANDVLKARVAELEAASGGGEQPRGWLTEEEREALGNLVAAIRPNGFSIYRDEIRTVESLLARSSPPEVVLPVADCSWCSDYATVWRECLEAVRSSLAAAGVAVKEVQ